MKRFKFCMLAVCAVVLVSSCKKDDTPITVNPKVTTGVYVLSEGLYNQNNTTVTFYNFSTNTASTDFFANSNGSSLGDTGNDMIIYGGKAYIVMNGSSYLEVADALTLKNVKKIDFKVAASAPRQPRYAAGYKNKVLVSSYDGTVAVIDTSSLTVDKFITVGANPEQIAISGDKLFVANSGGLNPAFDSTVSVIDLATFTEIRKVTVGTNPGSIVADNAGNVYVSCNGDFALKHAKLVKLNASDYAITKSADTTVGKIRFYNGLLYATGGYQGSSNVRTLSTTDFAQTRANFVTDGTKITLPYGMSVDESNGDVYVGDAKNYISTGEVFCFDNTGKKKFSFSVAPGINPNSIVLIKQ